MHLHKLWSGNRKDVLLLQKRPHWHLPATLKQTINIMISKTAITIIGILGNLPSNHPKNNTTAIKTINGTGFLSKAPKKAPINMITEIRDNTPVIIFPIFSSTLLPFFFSP